MDLSDDQVQQRAVAARREVDPPIPVEMAKWSKPGQLDWWVKNGRDGGVAYEVQTAVNGGSELLIFVPRQHIDGVPPGTGPPHEVRTPLTAQAQRRSTERVCASIASSRGE
jgi:hypothetical protein